MTKRRSDQLQVENQAPNQAEVNNGEHTHASPHPTPKKRKSVNTQSRNETHHAVVHDPRGDVRASIKVSAVRVLRLVRHLLVALVQGPVVRVRAPLSALFVVVRADKKGRKKREEKSSTGAEG